MMIENDKQYSITRYWRDRFSEDVEEDETTYISSKMWEYIRKSYQSQAKTLQGELDEYLRKTGKHDDEFPYWEPED